MDNSGAWIGISPVPTDNPQVLPSVFNILSIINPSPPHKTVPVNSGRPKKMQKKHGMIEQDPSVHVILLHERRWRRASGCESGKGTESLTGHWLSARSNQ